MLLRHYLERGLSKAEIARELGVSRRTVYHWIEGGQLERDLDNIAVQYTPRPSVACKIDGFRPIIDTRLAEFPKLTATRLFDEICAAGYDGGYTQVKEYVRQVRPAPVPGPVVRFETPPGRQEPADRRADRVRHKYEHSALLGQGHRAAWAGPLHLRRRGSAGWTGAGTNAR